MKTEVNVVAEIDRLVFGYWDEDKEEFIELRTLDSSKEAEIAEKFGCNPLLVDALIVLTEGIIDAVGQDLKDIWKKVNS